MCDYVKLSLFILAWAWQLWWALFYYIFTIFLSFHAVASSWSCCICKVSTLLRSGFLNSGGNPSESHFIVPQLNIPLWRRDQTKEMDVKNLKLCQKYDIWCNTYTFNMKCSGKEYIFIFVSQIVVFITNQSKTHDGLCISGVYIDVWHLFLLMTFHETSHASPCMASSHSNTLLHHTS